MSTNQSQPGKGPAGKADPAGAPADFESAVEQIEQIIARIESGEIGLEDSIAQYERGVGLIRRCREVLDRAEQRVEELTSQMQEDAGRERGGSGPRETEQEPSF